MNKVKWIFEPDCFGDHNPERMAEIAKRHGHEFQMLPHNLTEFQLGRSVKMRFPDDECVLAYGSIELVKYLQRHHRWYPGDWCDWEKLRAVSYLAHWGTWSIHHNYTFLPLAEVIRYKVHILISHHDGNTGVFIRTDANDKRGGPGAIVNNQNWDQWLKGVQAYELAPETLMLVSTPTKINQEWRCVVAEGKLLTASRYMLNGSAELERVNEKSEISGRLSQLCETILSQKPFFPADKVAFSPAPIFTMDIAEDYRGYLYLLEIGSINTSGLYECDLEKVFVKASELAEKECVDVLA